MKKLLVVLAAVTLSFGVKAQDSKMHDSKAHESKMEKKEHIMMKGGKMMMMKDGKWVPMDMEMTMKNGTVVMVDGNCRMKDGKTMMMKEGEGMDMDGNMVKGHHEGKMSK